MISVGKWGEERARDYLRKRGYKIVSMNYRTRFGEIDIIARNRQMLVFAEVKLRKDNAFAEAREFVDYRKQEKLRKSAEIWLSQNLTELQPRFDVIEIYAPDGINPKSISIEHIENAF